MRADRPERLHDYTSPMMDSRRWAGFKPRDDDIVVCTSYKAGTTWTQMICALLVLQKTDLGRPLTEISPWVDIQADPIEDVLATYEAQKHRRFIKTHTPLDGLPYFENATYLFCGRDPRDVFMSMLNHIRNTDQEAIKRITERQGLEPIDLPELPDDPDPIFRMWLTVATYDWEKDGFPFWSHFHHAETFWNYRHLPNLHFLHYADLQADLEGQMRRVAGLLDIEVDESLWAELVPAAGFDHMKKNADRYAPEVNHGFWRDNSRFFHKGTSGQWREALSPESLALYDEVKPQRVSPELGEWLEKGSLVCGDPKEL